MKKLREKLKDKSGLAYIKLVYIVIGISIFCVIIVQYSKVNIHIRNIKDGVQKAVISTVVGNYSNIYHGTREGYATAYAPTDVDWNELIDYGDIYSNLSKSLNLTNLSSDRYERNVKGKAEYIVHSLEVDIENITFRSDNTIDKFNADVRIKVVFPLKFLDIKKDFQVLLRLKAGYLNKF